MIFNQVTTRILMIDNREFFIDLVSAIPTNTEWRMQSSCKEVFELIKGIPIVKEGAVFRIFFKAEFRNQIFGLSNNDVFECINFLEVLEDGKKLLEAFDGFVIVTISKDFEINRTALPEYLSNDLLYISDVW